MKEILFSAMLGLLLLTVSAWAGDFTVSSNGTTVTDNNTGLEWQRQDDGITRTWESAIAYCENLPLDNKTDWRLPNIKELESITDDSRYNPAIDTAAFPGTKSSHYWSSTSYANNTLSAWSVSFGFGDVFNYYKTYFNYVRCVRGGQ
jgi:hypothetical protein